MADNSTNRSNRLAGINKEYGTIKWWLALCPVSGFLYCVCMAESQIMGLVCTHNSLAPRLREFVGSFGIMDLPFYPTQLSSIVGYLKGHVRKY